MEKLTKEIIKNLFNNDNVTIRVQGFSTIGSVTSKEELKQSLYLRYAQNLIYPIKDKRVIVSVKKWNIETIKYKWSHEKNVRLLSKYRDFIESILEFSNSYKLVINSQFRVKLTNLIEEEIKNGNIHKEVKTKETFSEYDATDLAKEIFEEVYNENKR